jgi:hypothetical protein
VFPWPQETYSLGASMKQHLSTAHAVIMLEVGHSMAEMELSNDEAYQHPDASIQAIPHLVVDAHRLLRTPPSRLSRTSSSTKKSSQPSDSDARASSVCRVAGRREMGARPHFTL